MKLSDRTSLLSVVSHSLSAYITTLEPAPLQRLSARIASEVSLWLCDLFKFTNGAAYCHDDTREGKSTQLFEKQVSERKKFASVLKEYLFISSRGMDFRNEPNTCRVGEWQSPQGQRTNCPIS